MIWIIWFLLQLWMNLDILLNKNEENAVRLTLSELECQNLIWQNPENCLTLDDLKIKLRSRRIVTYFLSNRVCPKTGQLSTYTDFTLLNI